MQRNVETAIGRTEWESADASFALIPAIDRTDYAVVSIETDFMYPTLRRDDCVLVDRTIADYFGDGLYVLDIEGYRKVCRAEVRGRGRVLVWGDNKLYGNGDLIDRADFRDLLFGKVIARVVIEDQRLMNKMAGRPPMPMPF